MKASIFLVNLQKVSVGRKSLIIASQESFISLSRLEAILKTIHSILIDLTPVNGISLLSKGNAIIELAKNDKI
uniref:Uncharacterized protein n=1 Tax=Octopus bimaculoides TaxID=37653 RepID=A0A0L8HFJ1_OCTBM